MTAEKKFKSVSIILFLVFIAAGIAGLYFSSNLRFEYDIERFFSGHSREIDYYKEFKADFGSDINFLVIGIEADEEKLFNTNFFNRLDALCSQLDSNQRIKAVISPLSLKEFHKSPFGLVPLRLIHPDDQEQLIKDSLKIYSEKKYLASFFSSTKPAISLIIHTDSIQDPKQNQILLIQIKNLLEHYAFKKYHIAGRIQTRSFYIKSLNTDLLRLTLISIFVLIFILWFIYRRFWGIWIPGIILLLSVLFTGAIIYLSGHQLDLMMTMLPSLLLVIGVSDVIHIQSKFLEERRKGIPKFQAIKTTIREIGLATFLTSLTTSVGFFSLLIIQIKPVQNFGVYAGIGVLITFLVSILLLPAIFYRSRLRVHESTGKSIIFFEQNIHKLLLWIKRFQKSIFITFGTITLLSLASIFFFRVDNNFLDDLPENAVLKDDVTFFESEFSGIRPLEIGIKLNDNQLFNLNTLSFLEKLEKKAQEIYSCQNLTSPLNVIREINQAQLSGHIQDYRLPKNNSELHKIAGVLKKYPFNKLLNSYSNSNQDHIRMSGRIKDMGSHKLSQLNEDFFAYIHSIKPEGIQVHFSGAAYLLDVSNQVISKKLLQGLFLAILIISVIIFALYRSLRIVFIALLVNIIPMLWVAGIMVISGISLKIPTALIFTIAFGIAVDDTIHLLSKLRIELQKGNKLSDALEHSFIKTGKAVFLTSMILSAGFIVLLFSDFPSTQHIGLFIVISMIIALLADIVLLPLLILKFYKVPKRI